MILAECAIRRPVTTAMVTLSTVALGFIALQRLPVEELPSITSSSVTVSVSYPSTAPGEIERDVTLPLEEALAILPNIERMSATSSANGSSVRVEFVSGTHMDAATVEVRDRVDQVRGSLPAEIDRLRIFRWQSGERPIVHASIAWRGQGDRLSDLVDKVVVPRLLRLDGVVDVSAGGVREKQLIVELDQERLESLDVSAAALRRAVRDNNVNVSLGRVAEGGRRYQVRAVGEFQDVDEIGELPVAGGLLRLEDAGRVSYDYPEKTNFRRLNGSDAVTVEVHKSSTQNVVEVARRVREALDAIESEYDGRLDIEIFRDRSQRVLTQLSNLTDAALIGGMLAIGIIFLFLRSVRSTLVIAVAIPVSVFVVFVGMYVAREMFESSITLNMVSMMGLMLAVGMLVDPAVVTLESIFRRGQEQSPGKEDPVRAALDGSREIGMAVIASTLTTMCVFIPFFFLSSGRMAQWMRDAGLTICLAVFVSMVVSLALIPLSSSRLLDRSLDRHDRWLGGLLIAAAGAVLSWKLYGMGMTQALKGLSVWTARVSSAFTGMQWTTATALITTVAAVAVLIGYARRYGFRQSYGHLLGWTLAHRFWVMLLTVATLGLAYYLSEQIEQQGTPWQPERRVDITVEIERSYGLDEVQVMFGQMEQALLSQRDRFDIESLSSRFRRGSGSLTARLVDADEGELTSMEAGRKIRGVLPSIVGVNYKLGRQRSWSGPQLGVEVQLKGLDVSVLEVLAEEISISLSRLPGVQDVDTSLEDGDEEIRVQVNGEQALSHGLSARDVAASIAAALGTRRASTFKAADREIDVVLQLEEEDRVSLEQLKNMPFQGQGDTRVPLATLADFQVREGPRSLQREDRQHTLTVFANTENRMQAMRLTRTIEGMMEEIPLPAGYTWQMGRAARWMRQDVQEGNFTLLFALLLIYLIMASLFESLVHPFTIMLSIPFSLIGVYLGLYVLDVPLDNNGVTGLLILFGIVVNNGIVLVDHINQHRQQGMSRELAIIQGGQNRLRPIVMTAATTVLNLMPLVLPMVYGTSEGFARRWGPVGLVVSCGLASSTILTLILAPTLYSLMDDLAVWMRRVASRATHAHQTHE